MNGRRLAVVVSVEQHDDPVLRRFTVPSADVPAFVDVLREPALGGFDVDHLRDPGARETYSRMKSIFDGREQDDCVLVYFRGVMLTGPGGGLYLAAADTVMGRPADTAVDVAQIAALMQRSRAGQAVVLLDGRTGSPVDAGHHFRAARSAEWQSRVVIAATARLEPPTFAGLIADGVTSGAADRDRDGWIGIGELHDHLRERDPSVRQWVFGSGRQPYLARVRRQGSDQMAQIAQLAVTAAGEDLSRAVEARESLRRLATGEGRVAAAASAALRRTSVRLAEPVVDFGRVAPGTRQLGAVVAVQGPPLAAASVVSTSAEGLHARLEGNILRVAWFPTVGRLDGAVTLEGPAGSASLTVTGEVAEDFDVATGGWVPHGNGSQQALPGASADAGPRSVPSGPPAIGAPYASPPTGSPYGATSGPPATGAPHASPLTGSPAASPYGATSGPPSTGIPYTSPPTTGSPHTSPPTTGSPYGAVSGPAGSSAAAWEAAWAAGGQPWPGETPTPAEAWPGETAWPGEAQNQPWPGETAPSAPPATGHPGWAPEGATSQAGGRLPVPPPAPADPGEPLSGTPEAPARSAGADDAVLPSAENSGRAPTSGSPAWSPTSGPPVRDAPYTGAPASGSPAPGRPAGTSPWVRSSEAPAGPEPHTDPPAEAGSWAPTGQTPDSASVEATASLPEGAVSEGRRAASTSPWAPTSGPPASVRTTPTTPAGQPGAPGAQVGWALSRGMASSGRPAADQASGSSFTGPGGEQPATAAEGTPTGRTEGTPAERTDATASWPAPGATSAEAAPGRGAGPADQHPEEAGTGTTPAAAGAAGSGDGHAEAAGAAAAWPATGGAPAGDRSEGEAASDDEPLVAPRATVRGSSPVSQAHVRTVPIGPHDPWNDFSNTAADAAGEAGPDDPGGAPVAPADAGGTAGPVSGPEGEHSAVSAPGNPADDGPAEARPNVNTTGTESTEVTRSAAASEPDAAPVASTSANSASTEAGRGAAVHGGGWPVPGSSWGSRESGSDGFWPSAGRKPGDDAAASVAASAGATAATAAGEHRTAGTNAPDPESAASATTAGPLTDRVPGEVESRVGAAPSEQATGPASEKIEDRNGEARPRRADSPGWEHHEGAGQAGPADPARVGVAGAGGPGAADDNGRSADDREQRGAVLPGPGSTSDANRDPAEESAAEPAGPWPGRPSGNGVSIPAQRQPAEEAGPWLVPSAPAEPAEHGGLAGPDQQPRAGTAAGAGAAGWPQSPAGQGWPTSPAGGWPTSPAGQDWPTSPAGGWPTSPATAWPGSDPWAQAQPGAPYPGDQQTGAYGTGYGQPAGPGAAGGYGDPGGQGAAGYGPRGPRVQYEGPDGPGYGGPVGVGYPAGDGPGGGGTAYPEDEGKPPQRRLALVAGVLVVLLLLAGGTYAGVRFVLSNDEPQAAPRTPAPTEQASQQAVPTEPAGTQQPPAAPASRAKPVVLEQIKLGQEPEGVAVSPDNRTIYVADQNSRDVHFVDVQSKKIGVVKVPNTPRFLALSADGSRLYVSLFENNFTGNGLAVIDTVNRSLVKTIRTGPRPFEPAVAPDGKIWLPIHNGARVEIYDDKSLTEAARISVPPNPHWVVFTPDGQTAFTANHESSQISVVSVADRLVRRNFKVGKSPHALAVTPDGKQLVATNYDLDTVEVYDTGDQRLLHKINVGREPQAVMISGDGRHAYVVNEGSDNLSVIDLSSGKVVSTVGVGDSPRVNAVSPDGKRLYVTDGRGKTVTVLRTSEE